ncbi:MAG: radical SAM family heme chaperone HemW [Acidobacteria bacterium]|nr:radical SAM family heme chaperone HemW [Acidobacteriota bacterium]
MAAGIYLSIPFCRQKCTYCNFASEARAFSALPSYLSALSKEIAQSSARWEQAGLPRYEGAPADSIFMGGGTPGLLNGGQLRNLILSISARFSLEPDAEITIEASPENIGSEGGAERAAEWAAAGVNRVSMGVQSMVERELRAVGRQHTAATVAEACNHLRQVGIYNISIDLIAGLPHQTAESWQGSLDAALALGVPHISVYMLEVDENSRLGGELLRAGPRYGAGAVPPEEAIVEFYFQAMARLNSNGYEHYEISNFAQPGRASRHNEKYWTAAPYFGFGVDAHSYDGHHRWANTDSIDSYLQGIESNALIFNEPRALSDTERREERFFLGLRRREGIQLDHRDVENAEVTAQINSCIASGWVERNEGRVRLTNQGVVFSNEVFAGFLGIA